MVEHRPYKPRVAGSKPAPPTTGSGQVKVKGGEYRAIDDIICLNVIPLVRSSDEKDYMGFSHASRYPNRAFPHELFQSLSDSWKAELEAAAGRTVDTLTPGNPVEFLESLRFPKPS